MSNRPKTELLTAVRRVLDRAGECPSDADLLQRFAQQGDASAFELLVRRHADMVFSVCRRRLRDDHAAEDAFQATFLVLFRKAKSLKRSESLGAWLHRVAWRISLRARQPAPVPQQTEPAVADGPVLDHDIREALHAEIELLPDYYRAAVVCCYLQGRTHEEAAALLGWSKGTLAGRLARARELLRRRLARRGICESALSAPVVLLQKNSRPEMLGQLLRGLQQPDAATLSPEAVSLAQGMITPMFGSKLKGIALLLFTIGLVCLSVTAGMGRDGGQAPKPVGVAQEQSPPPAKPKADPVMDELMRRTKVRRSLHMIAIAAHSYHDAVGQLPPPAITDKKGQPLLSWRVALLPYLEEGNLYRQFKLDQPWDSPHNKQLVDKMPALFAIPGSKAKNMTYFQFIVGPGAIFTNHKRETPMEGGGGFTGAGFPGGGVGAPPGGLEMGMGGIGGTAGGGPPGGMMMARQGTFASILDGMSNTMLVAEAARPAPWTKPEDVAYNPKGRPPAFGGEFGSVFHVAFADGSVRSLPRRVDEKTLHALITATGGEPVDTDKLPGTPGMSPLREEALNRLRKRNGELREEIAGLRDVLSDLREEVLTLRWAIEADRILLADPEATKLKQANAELEKALKDGREEARKLLEEVKQLKQEMLKRKKP